jgi:L-galactose dehydrogenase
MEYRTLGQTGLKVSALGYGASPLGSVFSEINEPDGIRTVHAALDLGINYIDVSPYYGLTKAETVLGKALHDIGRDRYYVATKVGRYGGDVFDFSAARVTASIDESLTRLGLDYVDVLQCHDIEFGSLEQIIHETIPALQKIRDQGKARFIGITGLPLKIFETVLAQAEVDIVLSYCRYNLYDTSLTRILPLLTGKKLGIISASPLGMGLLTHQGVPVWHPAPVIIRETCARAAAFCREQGHDIAQLALQFALANPAIQTTLVGMADPVVLQKNLECFERPLDQALLAEVQNILAPIHNQTWLSGRPENNDPL